jgi:neutral amino acid transport system permease protein
MVEYLMTFLGAKEYLLLLVTSIAIYSIFSLGLNLHWGFTGLLNFGNAGFMAIGAYTTVLLTLAGLPWVLSLLVGGLLAALLGLLMGVSTLKLREDYLAIVTIGASEIVRTLIGSRLVESITSGQQGLQGFPIPLQDFKPNLPTRYAMMLVFSLVVGAGVWQLCQALGRRWRRSERKPIGLAMLAGVGGAMGLYLWVLSLESLNTFREHGAGSSLLFLSVLTLGFFYVVLEKLVRSPWGRVLKAIREDEEVAKALGKNVFLYKLQSLMLGGFIAGVGGTFSAWQISNLYPKNFNTDITFNAWIIVILGGSGSNPGTILGAAIFWIYNALTRLLDTVVPPGAGGKVAALRIMLIGLILMIMMIWRPQGILGNKDELTLGK